MSSTVEKTLKIVGVLAAAAVLYSILDVIAFLLLAFVFASALRPGVNFLEKKKIPRFLGGIVVFLIFLSFFFSIFLFALPPLISDVQNFISTLPEYWQNFLDWLPKFEEWKAGAPFEGSIEEAINKSIQGVSQATAGFLGFVYGFFGQTLNFLFVLIVAFYLAIEKKTAEKFSEFFFENNKKLKAKISKCWEIAEDKAGSWLQGYVVLSFVVGALVYIGLSFLGVKNSLVLAVLAGLLEIIPFLGPVLAGIIGTLFAFLQGGLSMGLWAVFIFFIVQQLENYLIVPLVMKNKVDLNPLLTIVVLFIGGRIFGVIGMILAVPITAILISWWKEQKKDV